MPPRRTLRTTLATVLAVAALAAAPSPVPGASGRAAAGGAPLVDLLPVGGPDSSAPGGPPGAVPVANGPPEPVLHPPVAGALVRGFEAPASDFGPGHRGVDFAAGPGTPVAAPAAGLVVFAGQVAGVLWVAITLAPAALLSIGPLAELRVRAGQSLRAGDVLGLAGGAGAVHLGLRIAGAYTDPLPHLVRIRRPRLVPLSGPGARATIAPVPPSPPVVAPLPPGARP